MASVAVAEPLNSPGWVMACAIVVVQWLASSIETGKYFPNCESVVKELKKQDCLKDYKKTQSYYKNKNNDIYKRLKEYQKDASVRAKKLGSFDFENTKTAKAELYKVFELFDL